MDFQRGKNWCFTVNNWTSEHVDILNRMPYSYLVYGKEVGDNGTPHLQGYIQLKRRKYRSSLSKLLPCYWELAKGSSADNRAYCTKHRDFFEDGVSSTGLVGGSLKLVDRILRNKRLITVPFEELVATGELHPNQVRGLKNGISDIVEQRRLSVVVSPLEWPEGSPPNVWYWGPAGTGKSFRARKEFPLAFDKPCNKWWDGYNFIAPVIIEDFDKRHECLIHFLKRWADRYPFTGEVKGGTSYSIRPPSIVVTSNYHPRDIWTHDTDLSPIERRFKIVHVPVLVQD